MLLVLAAALLAFSAVVGVRAARRPIAVAILDDPGLEVRLDINNATLAELETLPGVGKALAGRIEAYRSTHGPFRSVDELRQVPGFGEKLVVALRPLLTAR